MASIEHIGPVLYAASLWYLTIASAVAAPPSIGATSLFQQASNLSDISQHFRVVVSYEAAVPLDTLGILNLGLIALARSAGMDHKGRYGEAHYSDTEKNLVLDIVPRGPRRDYGGEVANLCLYKGMEDVISKQRWTKVMFGCYLDNIEVAAVTIDHGPQRAQKLSVPGDQSISNATNVTYPSLNALTPTFHYTEGGEILSYSLVYMTLMNAILAFSYFSRTDVLRKNCYTDPGPRWDAHILFSPEESERTEPPFLEYQWIIRTLIRSPRYMLQRGRFGEFNVDFGVDDVLLGNAALEKGKPSPTLNIDLCYDPATA